jgi:mono/diheme cytochrome c family protein
MKKIITITAIVFSGAVAFTGCDSNREPGKVYMPDMAYSRAYESYAMRDSTKFTMDRGGIGDRIFYNAMPVKGTIRRGENVFPYPLANDSVGYLMSATIKNPYDSLSKNQMAEAGRLFNINCAICHGAKGTGDGPLSASGKIGGVANFTDEVHMKLADGTMFHSINYGKGVMGSYASQLTPSQRWMIIKYIRTLQPKPGAAGAAPAAGADSTKAKTK